MKVNIYEFQSEQRYKINPDTLEIEKDLIYKTNKNPKFVESFETVDMKLQQGDIVKGQVVVGADIVQDGYDVYGYEYTGKNITVNLEHYKHLKNLLFKANKFKNLHVKRRILKIKKDPDISDLTLTDIEEIYKDCFEKTPSSIRVEMNRNGFDLVFVSISCYNLITGGEIYENQ